METNIKEIWKDVLGYEGLYSVSNMGNVMRMFGFMCNKNRVANTPKCQKILKLGQTRCGYSKVSLTKNNSKKTHLIHRLVLFAFMPDSKGDKNSVNHKNGIKTDNRIENLEWCTPSENTRHGIRIGLINFPKGYKHPLSKLTPEKVNEIIKILSTTRRPDSNKIGLAFNVSGRTIRRVQQHKEKFMR